MVRTTIAALFVLMAANASTWFATPAEALLLCAPVDASTAPRENALVRLRSVCKTRADGTPLEVSIGSTEQLAAIATIAGRLNTVSETWPNGFSTGRWKSNADGTTFDRITGLLWERKSDDGSIHDKDDTYIWSSGTPWEPNGTAFTVFLATLNTEPCFAGYCDWRLPTIDELQSLNEAPTGDCGDDIHPCYSFPGATADSGYWSTSDGITNAPNEINSWWPNFRGTFGTIKDGQAHVRAVRGGASQAAAAPARPPGSQARACTETKRVPVR